VVIVNSIIGSHAPYFSFDSTSVFSAASIQKPEPEFVNVGGAQESIPRKRAGTTTLFNVVHGPPGYRLFRDGEKNEDI
jgi:hypothetical protein